MVLKEFLSWLLILQLHHKEAVNLKLSRGQGLPGSLSQTHIYTHTHTTSSAPWEFRARQFMESDPYNPKFLQVACAGVPPNHDCQLCSRQEKWLLPVLEASRLQFKRSSSAGLAQAMFIVQWYGWKLTQCFMLSKQNVIVPDCALTLLKISIKAKNALLHWAAWIRL